MKRIVLCMLAAGLIMSATAQEKVFSFTKSEKIVVHEKDRFDLGISSTPETFPANPAKSLLDVNVEGWTCAGISQSYDRQTQNAVYPMTKLHDDGFIGCTWTNGDNPDWTGDNLSKMGIGYAYSTDGGLTWSQQENRLGGIPLYLPSYAQWGNGEAVLGKSAETYEYDGVQILNGLVLLTREHKGQGEWTITPVPYPAGTSPEDNYFMAWARMTTSGDNHQYIHIMSPMRLPEGQTYNDYYNPVFYYRTQDGGATWDMAGELVPAMVGQKWDAHSEYIDAITFADTGINNDMVACAFIAFGNDGYVLKSHDNGDTWQSIKFFNSPVGHYISPSEYADTCYIPTQGCIALDSNGKAHVAFSVVEAMNSEDEGYTDYFAGSITSSFLSYWSEDMGTIDGDSDFAKDEIEPILMDYFDWELSNEHTLCVKSAIPKMPIIGYFPATTDKPCFPIDLGVFSMQNCYGMAGPFSFPQMTFDENNTLHLTYLGILSGLDDIYWRHHPFYTTRSEDGTWTETEYLVGIDFNDREFAYLTLAGIDDNQWVRLMAQVDSHVGTYIGTHCQLTPTDNYFIHFSVEIEHKIPAINDIEKPSLSMTVIPNPASEQATVRFDGKGSITIYNMLGQTVYRIENVENEKVIPLNNMAAGIYFVTVRSENEKKKKKMVVKQ